MKPNLCDRLLPQNKRVVFEKQQTLQEGKMTNYLLCYYSMNSSTGV